MLGSFSFRATRILPSLLQVWTLWMGFGKVENGPMGEENWFQMIRFMMQIYSCYGVSLCSVS